MNNLIKIGLVIFWFSGLFSLSANDDLSRPTTAITHATVVNIYDGDTLTVEAQIWPQQVIRTKVRIRGIDTPEIRSKCAKEKEKAKLARMALVNLTGSQVILSNIAHGKFAGRVIADVFSQKGVNLGQEMIKHNHARPYKGGRRQSWCP